MTYSLMVADGDLVQIGSQMNIVSGRDKLMQDLQLWVGERYGIDRFHPRMGSELQSWIGSVIGENTNAAVRQEILRVLRNYERVQSLAFKRTPQLFALAELLFSIDSVRVGTSFDTVAAQVSVTNGTGQSATVGVTQGV